MPPSPATTTRPSPLDPFLGPFLEEVARHPDGFSPISHGRRIAEERGWPLPFIEALFTSARTRGLIEPFRSPSSRGRPRWRVSAAGQAWLDTGPPDAGVD